MRHGGTHESFGIDLGPPIPPWPPSTTTTAPRSSPTTSTSRQTPSVLYFESPEHVVVGVEAKNMAEIEPERVEQFVKRFMGRNDEFLFEFAGKAYQPEELSALILKALVEKARQNLQAPVEDVVITVPAYFDDAQRTAPKMRERWRG